MRSPLASLGKNAELSRERLPLAPLGENQALKTDAPSGHGLAAAPLDVKK